MSSKRLPPLNSLRNFEAAARLGSFRKASQELFVTPSAVSHQVKALEEFLQVALFERHTRRIELTSAGRDYLRSVQKALDEIERGTQRVMVAHTGGELNLAVAPAFLTRWMIPRMTRFYDQYPNIELDITASIGLIDFAHSDREMAVYFGNGDWKDVKAHFLKSSELIPVCAPSLLDGKTVTAAADLLRLPLLHVSKRPHEWPDWCEEAGAEFNERRKGLTLSSSLLTARAASKGLGVALADINLISDDIQSGQLVAPVNVTLKRTYSFYLVYEKNRPMTPAMRQFKDWIMAEMANDALTAGWMGHSRDGEQAFADQSSE